MISNYKNISIFLFLFSTILAHGTDFFNHLSDPLLKLVFNSDTKINTKIKISKKQTSDKVKFKNGLLLNSGNLVYNLAKTLKLKQGSIVIWFRPDLWDDKSFINILKVYDIKKSQRKIIFRIYRLPNSSRGICFLEYPSDNAAALNTYCLDLYVQKMRKNATQWHQCVFTWNKDMRRLYVDGLEVAVRHKKNAELNIGNELFIGGPSYRYDNKRKIITKTKTTLAGIAVYKEVIPAKKIMLNYEAITGSLIAKDNF